MKIVVGSASKRKISIVEKIAQQIFKDAVIDVVGYAAKSGVPDTPYGRETFEGAKNRVLDAQIKMLGADCYVGLESGLVERYTHVFEEAWCVLLLQGREYYGYSSGLKVPDCILKKMDELGKPHSEVMRLIEEQHDKTSNDTWGTYSGGLIVREVSLGEAVRNAFIQGVESENSLFCEVSKT
ncbi:MAG: inosine/xanthosine triphosphatase [Patescibacteria group bacterium]